MRSLEACGSDKQLIDSEAFAGPRAHGMSDLHSFASDALIGVEICEIPFKMPPIGPLSAMLCHQNVMNERCNHTKIELWTNLLPKNRPRIRKR